MEPLEQEHGNQGCPNLNAQGILADSDERFDSEVLFEGFEEQFDLPPFPVDFSDGSCSEIEMIGEQNDFPLVFFIPYDDAAQEIGTLGLGVNSGKADDLIGKDIAALGRPAPFDDLVHGVFLHAGDEVHALGYPGGELFVDVVRPVHDDDRTGGQRQEAQDFGVMAFGFGYQDKGRHIVIVVQEDVRFDAAFGTPELRPGKQAQTQRYGGRVQREKLVLEAEFVLARPQLSLVTESLKKTPEEVFEQGRGAMLIGIGQGRFVGGVTDAHMHQLPQTTGETVTDFAQRIGAGKLTEQHADELRPTAEPACVAFRLVLLHQGDELRTGDLFEKLTEQTGGLYHGDTLLVNVVDRFFHTRFFNAQGGLSSRNSHEANLDKSVLR